MRSVWLDLTRRWALWLVLLEIVFMLSSAVRRSVLSLLAVSTVGTMGFSAVATLDLTGGDLAAGDAVVASCATGAVTVTYASLYLADPANGAGAQGGRFFVDDVILTGAAVTTLDDCEGDDVAIAFIGDDDEAVYTHTTQVPQPASGIVTIPIGPAASGDADAVASEEIEHVAVVISGSAPTPAP